MKNETKEKETERRGASALTRLLGTREIKFRAKRIDNGQWVCGFFFETPLTTENFESNDGKDFFDSGLDRLRPCISEKSGVVYEIDADTLGQYTGQNDMNGREIYVGDVLEYIYKDEMEEDGYGSAKNLIGYHDSCFCWKGENTGKWFPLFEDEMGNEQVAGNIFDHPELIDECT